MSQRLDSELVIRKLVHSRTEGVRYIEDGYVYVNGVQKKKANTQVQSEDEIVLTYTMPFVSRAGEKLEYALNFFNLVQKVEGSICLDIGSSTGGFTDCLLQNGASHVVCIDVGTHQLANELRENSKIELHEQTDFRDFVSDKKFDFVVIDVSFISLTYILEKAKQFLKKDGALIALIKPQFEVGKGGLGKGGIVHVDKHEMVIKKITDFSREIQLEIVGICESPIEGGSGNKEFLMCGQIKNT